MNHLGHEISEKSSEKNVITGKISSMEEMKKFLEKHNFSKAGIESIAQSFITKITEEKNITISDTSLEIGNSHMKIREGMRNMSAMTHALQKNTHSRALMILEHNTPMVAEHNLPKVVNDETHLVTA